MPKGLEILTSQNVTIEYSLATVADRIFSYMLDSFFILVIYFIIAITNSILDSIDGYDGSMATNVLGILLFAFYSLLSEYFMNGQSWGKRIMGLKIVKINGSKTRISDYVSRWAFRFIDIYFSAGTVAMFLISSTVKAQRVGDIVANTAVIRIKPRYSPNLGHIEGLKTLQNYEPVYNQVLQMNEEEMMSIKIILAEVQKYPNASHIDQLNVLSEFLCMRLQIQKKESSNWAFLQQLINDYIVLTR